ncbi:ROK family protein [Tundrisphaera lichenicola]|uniref:ROK family protein n=1 Tax=Tundrisphaera lichenicola TaxID=2029860 RepID=UPI003EC107EB
MVTALKNSRSRIHEQNIMRMVWGQGPSSRAEMVRSLNLSLPTVSKAVAWLLRARLLEEVEMADGAIGRPAKRLRMATESAQLLGVVIAPGNCSVGSAGLDGMIRPDRTVKVPTPKTYEGLIDALEGPSRALMEQPGVATLGIGICIPGLVDLRNDRSVLSANVRAIEGHSPTHDLAERLGVECVTLQSKHALCLAESYFGEARGLKDIVLLDLSTGMAIGVVSEGRLLRGKNGFAGEIGHIPIESEGLPCGCGHRGCLETVASDLAMAAKVSKKVGRTLEIDEVVKLVRSGQLSIEAEIEELIHYLSIALTSVINLFNPSTLFLNGRLFDLQEDLFPRLIEEARRKTLGPSFEECRIVRAVGDKMQGAVAAALQHLIESLASPEGRIAPTEGRGSTPGANKPTQESGH